MISHQTINSFIVCNCILWPKLDDYLPISISLNSTFRVIEQEDVVCICEKLKIGIEFWVICNCEYFGTGIIEFDLAEVDRSSIETYSESMWMSFEC